MNSVLENQDQYGLSFNGQLEHEVAQKKDIITFHQRVAIERCMLIMREVTLFAQSAFKGFGKSAINFQSGTPSKLSKSELLEISNGQQKSFDSPYSWPVYTPYTPPSKTKNND